jgi:plasmid stabilization system protein ParE
MDRLRLSATALKELKDAIDWYAARSAAAAARFAKTVDAAMDAIQAAPQTFPQLNDRYRYVQLRPFPYVMAFSIQSDVVTVHRVRHAAQDALKSED